MILTREVKNLQYVTFLLAILVFWCANQNVWIQKYWNTVYNIFNKMHYLTPWLDCEHNGSVKLNGDVFKIDKCTVCICRDGSVECDTLQCNPLKCPTDQQYLPANECCKKCKTPSMYFKHDWQYMIYTLRINYMKLLIKCSDSNIWYLYSQAKHFRSVRFLFFIGLVNGEFFCLGIQFNSWDCMILPVF